MAIKQVRSLINGTWYTLTLNEATGAYEAEITAPQITSFHQSGGYYNVTVEVTNDAGTVGTASGTTMESLRLDVNERIPPVITILSPTNGARVANNQQPVVFTVVDEANGSGINLSSLVVELDGVAVSSGEIATTSITNGYSVTFTPGAAMGNGEHTVTVNVSDNDGNAATEVSTTFTVDTVAPTLNVTSPTGGMVTSSTSIVLKGTTNDETSSPVSITATVNGTDAGAITVDSDGSFEKTLTLTQEGENEIIVTATDSTGLTTSVTILVTLNTAVPKVVSASLTPNPVDAGKTVIISVVVSE